jgi:hypothetical protein
MTLARKFRSVLIASLLCSTPLAAQVPKEQLLSPPDNAESFAIVSSGGEHGIASIWTQPDGQIASRISFLLRGMVTEADEVIKLGSNGLPEKIVLRGVNPSGDVAETFEIADGKAVWKSPIDSGSAQYDGTALYLPLGGTMSDLKYFAEALHKAPGRKLKLLPSGELRLSKLVDIPVGSGPTAKTISSWRIDGVSLDPALVLLDEQGKFFGTVQWLGLLPKAYAGDMQKITKAQDDALAAENPAMVERFGKVSPIPVAFTDVRLFDSLSGKFVDGQTVLVDKGRIKAVGDATKIGVPRMAKTIDGRGKTLLPGLWDAHMHVGSDRQGLMLLSMGETSARNPGGDVASTVERAGRIKRGELLFPAIYSSMLIDGSGPLAAQMAVTADTPEQAIAAVRQAKEKGFVGVKFYTSMQKEPLLAGVAEAKKLGLHVHGHIPAKLRPSQAIDAGYDEVTHINMVMMEAMPDSVVDVSNGIARFNGPGQYAKDVDLDAEPMKSLIAKMVAKKTVVDPTLVTFEGMYVPENGELQEAYAAFQGTLPATTERYFRVGGFQPPEGVTRADWRASFAKMEALVSKLYRAGVPIVAGTDGGGLELARELELYVRAGLTPGEALQTATIVPARMVGADTATGSITVGKEADLVLVEGDPSKDISAVRQTKWVMSDGALMNADELREAAGFSGPPR